MMKRNRERKKYLNNKFIGKDILSTFFGKKGKDKSPANNIVLVSLV